MKLISRHGDISIPGLDRRSKCLSAHVADVYQLGRGTAPQEGVGLSHAIAESLIQRKVRRIYLQQLTVDVCPLRNSLSRSGADSQHSGGHRKVSDRAPRI